MGFAWDLGNQGQTVVRGGWGLFYDKIVLIASIFTMFDASDVRGVFVFDPPFGPDNIPPFDTLLNDFGFGSSLDTVITPDYKFPRTSQATIGLSRQMTPNLALDVDYIYSHATQVGKKSDWNEMTVPFEETSRLFWPDRKDQMDVLESIGENTYHGLQVSLRKRFSNRVQYVVNYTLGRLSGFARAFGDLAECRACVGDERDVGPLPNDTTHRLVLSGIVQLPADFQVSALFQAENGRPISALTNEDINGNGRHRSFAAGPNGEAPGRGNFRGDPTYILDMRLVKFLRLGGARDLQLMVEAFNLFNQVNWGANQFDYIESPNFGEPTGELWTNQFQVQLGIRFSF